MRLMDIVDVDLLIWAFCFDDPSRDANEITKEIQTTLRQIGIAWFLSAKKDLGVRKVNLRPYVSWRPEPVTEVVK